MITRPSLNEVIAYRDHVDAGMLRLFDQLLDPRIVDLIELGLHHEQQHQELLLMDIKHLLSLNPLSPTYAQLPAIPQAPNRATGWQTFLGGLAEIGHAGTEFAFDNESPRHHVYSGTVCTGRPSGELR